MRMRHILCFGLLTGLLGGCANPPDVAAALGPDPVGTDYPALLPMDEILKGQSYDEIAEAQAQDDLDRRASALKSRASALRRAGTP